MAEQKTPFEKFSDQIPLTREVHLPMVVDSTVEVAIDIDTDIQSGSKMGWIIYGMRYQFRNIAAPYEFVSFSAAVDGTMILQLCRGEAPAVPEIIAPSSHDLIMEECLDLWVSTSVGWDVLAWPRTIRRSAVTQLPNLYLMFGTEADLTGISLVTVEIYAEILYHPVVAPKAPRESL